MLQPRPPRGVARRKDAAIAPKHPPAVRRREEHVAQFVRQVPERELDQHGAGIKWQDPSVDWRHPWARMQVGRRRRQTGRDERPGPIDGKRAGAGLPDEHAAPNKDHGLGGALRPRLDQRDTKAREQRQEEEEERREARGSPQPAVAGDIVVEKPVRGGNGEGASAGLHDGAKGKPERQHQRHGHERDEPVVDGRACGGVSPGPDQREADGHHGKQQRHGEAWQRGPVVIQRRREANDFLERPLEAELALHRQIRQVERNSQDNRGGRRGSKIAPDAQVPDPLVPDQIGQHECRDERGAIQHVETGGQIQRDERRRPSHQCPS